MKKNDVEIGAAYVAKVSGKLARVRIERESPHGGWEAVNVDTGRRVRIKSAQRLRRIAIDAKHAKAVAAADQENARLRDERERSPDGMVASERAMATSATRESAEPAATAAPTDESPAAAPTDESPAAAPIDEPQSVADADPDICATVGCGRPSALTYLGRARCQECYEDDVADGDETTETPNHEETAMAKAKKTTKKTATKSATATKSGKQPKPAKPKAAGRTTPKAAGPAKPKTTKPAGDAKPKRVSAIDAAAQILAQSGQPMRTKEMIETMAARGLWSSPNGKTPHATLYAAILREISVKGDASRFRKVERGQFAAAN